MHHTSSLIGNAAAECIARADHFDMDDRTQYQAAWRRKRGKPATSRAKRLPDPLPEDGVPDGTCRRCGIIGAHENAMECIDALRGMLAERLAE